MAKILIITGATSIPLDGVRKITNLATGKTGLSIAREAQSRGHEVTLLTSSPSEPPTTPQWNETHFESFDELKNLLQKQVMKQKPDAIVMAAAISDYGNPSIHDSFGGEVTPQAGVAKFPSDKEEVWIRLHKLPKLIDQIRTHWGFGGILVKFKLEAGISEERLLSVAETSRLHSKADLIVANRLEDFKNWTWVGPTASGFSRISRQQLPAFLLDTMQQLLEK